MVDSYHRWGFYKINTSRINQQTILGRRINVKVPRKVFVIIDPFGRMSFDFVESMADNRWQLVKKLLDEQLEKR